MTASAASYIVPLRENENVPVDYYRIGDSVTITMFKGGVINGTVTDTDGQPVVALRVRALMLRDANGQQSNPSMMSERLTDDRGVYRLYGLEPGTYVVSAGGGGDGGFGVAADEAAAGVVLEVAADEAAGAVLALVFSMGELVRPPPSTTVTRRPLLLRLLGTQLLKSLFLPGRR